MNIKRIPGLLIAFVGALLSIIGWVAMESADGFDGLAFGPVIYGGGLVFLFGIVKAVVEFKKSNSLAKIALVVIVAGIVVAMVVGNIITIRDSNRVKYCNQKYKNEYYSRDFNIRYDDTMLAKCINRHID